MTRTRRDTRTRGLLVSVDEDGGYSVTEFLGDLSALQEAVGGTVDVAPSHNLVTLWINDEGKNIGLRPNRLATDIWLRYDIYGCVIIARDYLAGNVVITGGNDGRGEARDLSREARAWIATVAADAGVRITGDRLCRKCGEAQRYATNAAPGVGGAWYCPNLHYEELKP